MLTLGENTPASPRLHKIGHGKPVGYGSCKITLTGGELRTLAQQDGTLCYTTEPLPLDSLLAAHGRIDTDSTSVKSLLKIADKRSTQSKTVEISECQRQKRQRQDFQLVLPEPQARKEPCYAAAPAGQQHYAGAEARP